MVLKKDEDEMVKELGTKLAINQILHSLKETFPDYDFIVVEKKK